VDVHTKLCLDVYDPGAAYRIRFNNVRKHSVLSSGLCRQVARDFIHVCGVVSQHRALRAVYKPSPLASMHQVGNTPTSTPSTALFPWDVDFFCCALLAMVLSPLAGLIFVDAPSCALFESICMCRLLPFVAGIVVAGDCVLLEDGVRGNVVDDLIVLDTFLNQEQKTKHAPSLFFLKGDMTSNATQLEPLGRRMLHLWNVLLTREIPTCTDTIGAARTVFTIAPAQDWCVDAIGTAATVVADFKALGNPRARVRAFALTPTNQHTVVHTFKTTRIIIASVSVWAISSLILFNYFT